MTADVRMVWLAAAAIFVLGAYRLETHYERAIDASKTAIETLYRSTTQNQRIVAHAAVLNADEAAADGELRGVSRERWLPAVTASLLITLQDSAHRCHIDVLALQPGTTIAEEQLMATELTLRVHGRFANLIAFLEDVSRHAEIVSVARTDLALASQNDSVHEPNLDATIHATLYRLQSESVAGEKHVASAR